MQDRLFIGLMSGTSCDGVDGVVTRFGDRTLELTAHCHVPFDGAFQSQLHRLQQSTFSEDPFHLAASAANRLMDAYAEAVASLLNQAALSACQIAAIGCHGQTIRHRPECGYTIQLHNAARLVERTGITVIADWRARDIAAGGQGAPLVPAFHQWLFRDSARHRVVVNLGGISNITDLPTTGAGPGFDCGPANTLLDAWVWHHLKQPYDVDGRWAASGTVLPGLLTRLLEDLFFAQKPPKSTGRDRFNLEWLATFLKGDEPPEDVQATLLQLTVLTVRHAIERYCGAADEVFVCGGGAHNIVLVDAIRAALPIPVQTTDCLGLSPTMVEAAAFAWLASQTLRYRPGNLPTATGASGERILGAIYPV